MVYKEAKALHTPVFSTETLSTKEMLEDGVDFICENNEEDLKIQFEKATESKAELQKRREKLNNYTGTNADVINTFQKWLGESVDK